MANFAVFRSLENRSIFFSRLREGESDENACRLNTGEIVYEILLKGSVAECKRYCHKHSPFPLIY